MDAEHCALRGSMELWPHPCSILTAPPAAHVALLLEPSEPGGEGSPGAPLHSPSLGLPPAGPKELSASSTTKTFIGSAGQPRTLGTSTADHTLGGFHPSIHASIQRCTPQNICSRAQAERGCSLR